MPDASVNRRSVSTPPHEVVTARVVSLNLCKSVGVLLDILGRSEETPPPRIPELPAITHAQFFVLESLMVCPLRADDLAPVSPAPCKALIVWVLNSSK